jgi:16S rRNA processing protein RimM
LNKADDLIQIGEVIGAHGISGGVKIYYYADSIEFLAPGTQVVIDSAPGRAVYKIVHARPHRKTVRVALEGVTTRNQAEALVGCGVFIPKERLPDLEEEDSYYWVDLIGLNVYSVSGEHLGEITGIIPTGANDVYVIQAPAGEILVPAIASVVLEIDLAGSRMIVELPEGLI